MFRDLYYEVKWWVEDRLYSLRKLFGYTPPEEYGFQLDVYFDPPISPIGRVDFVFDRFLELTESKALYSGGGLGPNRVNVFICGETCRREDARDLVGFFLSVPETRRVSVGAFVDANAPYPHMALYWTKRRDERVQDRSCKNR